MSFAPVIFQRETDCEGKPGKPTTRHLDPSGLSILSPLAGTLVLYVSHYEVTPSDVDRMPGFVPGGLPHGAVSPLSDPASGGTESPPPCDRHRVQRRTSLLI